MKTAVVYYSLDGNCAVIARSIKTKLNADLIDLRLTKEKKRGKVLKMLWGIGMMLSRKNPPLEPYTFDPAAYDLIVIGTPVWAGAPSPPLRTFLAGTAITGKKLALFVCHAGGKGEALAKLQQMLPGNEIVAETDFKDAVKNIDLMEQQLDDLLKNISLRLS